MTEHVHEWELDVHRSRSGRMNVRIGCKNKSCPWGLEIQEAEARLNATERLSAKVARRNGVILRLNADKLSYGEQTQGFGDSQDMIAYADILEGK